MTVEPDAALAFYLLGAFKVRRRGQALEGQGWRSRQNRTILKVLLTHRDRVVPGDQLIEILWPDTDPDRARQSLYVRISQVRRALNPDDPLAYIVTVEDGYTWNPDADCWIDAVAFEAQVRQARHHFEQGELPQAIAAFEAARTLYRGDFLEDTPYDDFTLAERERLREQALTALTELAEAYAQQGRYRRALSLCQEGLTVDPSRESLYVRLMLYHYYAGERTQALHAYERCRHALDQDLGVAPLPETQTLAARIRDGTLWQQPDSPRYPPPAYEGRLFEVPYSLGHAPFVGREREYAWLVAQWRDPSVTAVMIEGEAGIGKSRLVEEFLGYAESEGAHILRARAGSGEQLPYSPLISALRGCPGLELRTGSLPPTTRSALVPLFPELAGGCRDSRSDGPVNGLSDGRVDGHSAGPSLPALSAREERARLQAALVDLVTHCVPTDAILYIDDVHRADRSTLSLLSELAPHLMVVLTARSEETPADHPLRQTLRTLRREGRLATLTLEPLTAQAVAELIRQLAGEALPDLAQQLEDRSQGNPLFLLASVQWMFERGELYVDASNGWVATQTSPGTQPPTVQAIIEERLRRLPRAPRRLFDLIAVIADDFDFALLQRAAELEEGPALEGLDLLLDARLVEEPRAADRREFAPAHDRYIESAYETLPAVRRRQLHRRVAQGLVAESHDPDAAAPAVAGHFEQARDLESAFPWLVRAGDAASRRHAYEDAVAFYKRAIQGDAGEVGPVHERLGRIAHHTARYEDGVAHYTSALERWQALGKTEAEIEARFGLAECYRELSSFEAAATQARMALETAEALPSHRDLAARAHIILSNAFRSGQLASPEEIRAHLVEASTLAQEAEAWQTVGEASFWLGVVTVNGGDAEGALAYDREALVRFRQTGDAGWQAIALNNLAYHALLAGRPDEALPAAQEGLALARTTGARNSEGWLLSTLGEIQLHLGELEAARATLEEGLAFVTSWGPVRLLPGFQHDLARVAMAEGDWRAARHRLADAIATARDTAPQFVPRLRVALAEALLGVGGIVASLEQAMQAQGSAREKQQRSVEGRAWRIIGRAQAELDNQSAAEEAFARSLSLLNAVGDELEIARTCAAYGRHLLSRGDDRAQRLLQSACETFERCQAEVDLQRWCP